MKYYLAIDGVQGNSTAEGYEGWFEIDSFDFDISNPANTGGAGAGKATFSPLTIAMADGPLTALLEDAALGRHIESIRLVGVTEGPAPTEVYNLTLADVQVLQVHDGEGSETDRLVVDYGKFGLETKSLDASGAIDATNSFGFDIATNRQISDLSTLPDPTPGSTPEVAETAATKFYLAIDGLKGNSTVEGQEGWFEIDGFDFDASNSGVTGGSGSGKAVFSPLTIAMAAEGPLTALLKDAALGKFIDSIRLVGVTGGADPTEVYKLTLADVQVLQVHDGEGSASDRLVFDYGKFGLETKSLDDSGAVDATSSFGFDITANREISDLSTLPSPTPGSTPISAGASATKFYLAIDGLKGDSTAQHYENWFEIDGFDFDATNTGDTGVGAGAGKATFSPLAVEIAEGTLTALLKDVALGRHIESIRLVGVTGGPGSTEVYRLTLADVQVLKVQGGNGGDHDSVEFGYAKFGVVTKSVDDSGAVGATNSFGFDIVNNQEIKDLSTLPSPSTGPAPASGGAAATKFYLAIDGLKGDATAEGYEGWFEIDGFDFDASNPGSTGGAGAGKAAFSPLDIAMAAEGPLTALLEDVALGHHIESIRLVGVTGGADPTEVYKLTLAGVQVLQVHDGNGSDADRLVFDYEKFGLETKSLDNSGAVSATDSFGFDIVANRQITDLSTLPSPTPGPSPTLAGTAATKFYLAIDGLKGNSTAEGYEGWFEIDGFDFDASNPGSTGGAGAGKAAFSPLDIAMAAEGPLTALLNDVALGHHIESIRLVGVTGGADPTEVYKLTLADVQVLQVHDGEGSASDRLVFDYGKFGIETTSLDHSGAVDATNSFGFDIAANREITDLSTLPGPTPGPSPTLAGTAATKFYLAIDGLKGTSTIEGYEGWFAIDGFDFDISNPGTSSGSGAGAGKATFSPLTIAMAADDPLTAFLKDVALGHHIESIRLVGLTGGPDSAEVYNLTLAGVNVSQVHEGDGSDRDSVEFGYEKFGLVTRSIDNSGGVDATNSFGFDIVTNREIDDLSTLPSPRLSAAPVSEADTYNVAFGHTLHVDGPGVLGNDTDEDGDALTAHLVSDTTDGLLTFNEDGSFDYIAYTKAATTFQYLANDGTADGNVVTVTINVGTETDTLDFSASTANTTKQASGGIFNIVAGAGNDTLIANSAGSTLNGGAGNDIITGAAGNDVIIGGTGNDRVTGRGGDDVFVFRPGFGKDTVMDFQVGDAVHHDTLDLRGLGFASVEEVLAATSAGPSAVITIDAGNDITLLNVTKTLLGGNSVDILV